MSETFEEKRKRLLKEQHNKKNNPEKKIIKKEIKKVEKKDSKLNNAYKKVLTDSYNLIYSSNIKRYKSGGSSGMVNALNILKSYFDSLDLK